MPYFIMPKSTVAQILLAWALRALARLVTRLGASRPGSSGFLAPSALEPGVPSATMRQFKNTDGNLLGRSA